MRRIVWILMFVLLLAIFCAAFAQDYSLTFPISEDTEFGSVFIEASREEFAMLGAEFGDSLDIYLSNGFSLNDIPYYDGFYDRVNHPAVVNYPGLPLQVAFCSGDSMWKTSGSAVGDTIKISIREKGKYLDRQNTMASVYVDDREAFDSDEIFANFRVMTGGKLKPDMFYRGASPVDNIHQRAVTADTLLEKHGIQFILDLADNEKKINTYMEKENFRSNYSANLYSKSNIALLGLSAGYRGDGFKISLVNGLLEMMKHDGPYYIHCTEGKDRTGFVCLLLEALADASYEEIEADYMKTYENYYNISKENNPAKYNALKELRLHDMLWWMADLPDNTVLDEMSFKEAAENYLRSGGMSDDEIQLLENFLTE